MMTAGTLARWFTSTGIADYRPVEAGGDCFITATPDSPHDTITIIDLGGTVERPNNDRVSNFQIRFRGAPGNVTAARDRAAAATDSLLTLSYVAPTTVAEGTADEARIILCLPGSAALAGQDPDGRYEWVMRVTVRSSPQPSTP